jgi:hypothetical protein
MNEAENKTKREKNKLSISSFVPTDVLLIISSQHEER